jgi:hypothetical protein
VKAMKQINVKNDGSSVNINTQIYLSGEQGYLKIENKILKWILGIIAATFIFLLKNGLWSKLLKPLFFE